MEKEKLELISFITNELNKKQIPYLTKVAEVGTNNIWYDFTINFVYNGIEQTIIVSPYTNENPELNGISISGNILDRTPTKGAISKLRFSEFLDTLKDLLDKIEESTKIANDIVEYLYNKDTKISIYHIGDK